ncbi:hypothetical protein [Arthrobacter sp.]|uniref:hypothetical protein n=1 Tax=Arthrobacter sp. TaxID=1667 RepID=UPI0028110BE5|nr:hypothetical protein [Arthrobacter sp.]
MLSTVLSFAGCNDHEITQGGPQLSAVGAVTVTLDPESVYFVGRSSPLVDEVLPEARRRLAQSLPIVPEVRVVSQEIGLSVARGGRMPDA